MDTILWQEESDNYTKRALQMHQDLYGTNDQLEFVRQITPYMDSTKSINVLDIGCAYGATIFAMQKHLSKGIFYGIDPGPESISIARKNLPGVNLVLGHSHSIPFEDNSMDAIVLNMVLQWIPRNKIIATLSEMDRILKVGGVICFQDFLPNRPITSKSRHNEHVLIFKNDYARIMTGFPWFIEIYRVAKMYESEDQQRVVSVVRKYPLSDVYMLRDGAVEKNN